MPLEQKQTVDRGSGIESPEDTLMETGMEFMTKEPRLWQWRGERGETGQTHPKNESLGLLTAG